MRWATKGYKRRGAQHLAVPAHHKNILTTRHAPSTRRPRPPGCTPTTRGPRPPAETAAGSEGVGIFTLISSLALSLAFSACKGNVVRSLSTCYILWLCEIRHCVVEIFCQVIIFFQPHCTKSNVMKLQSYHLL